jgi:hypothetical protein
MSEEQTKYAPPIKITVEGPPGFGAGQLSLMFEEFLRRRYPDAPITWSMRGNEDGVFTDEMLKHMREQAIVRLGMEPAFDWFGLFFRTPFEIEHVMTMPEPDSPE